MSSYHRYSPANPPAHGPPPHSQYPSAQYPYSNEQYRGQPPIPQPPQGPLNLPPLRSIDPRQPQVLQPPISSGPVYGGAPMGGGGYSPMPGQMPPMEAGSQYYPGPVGNPSGPYDPAGYGSNQPMLRYPLAVGDTRRAYPAGRNKKEVKRRTKTGCMTCRKRRIKCDEGHPICKNCQKSKRECAGYDPMFKAQQGTSAQPPSTASSQSSTTTVGPSFQNSDLPGYGLGHPALLPTSSSGSSFEHPGSAASLNYPPAQRLHDTAPTSNMPIRRARRMKILELCSINDHTPPTLPPPGPYNPDLLANIITIWRKTYATSLCRLFETSFFAGPNAEGFLFGEHNRRAEPQWKSLLEWEFAHFYTIISSLTGYNDPPAVQGLEARLIWRLANASREYPPSEINRNPEFAKNDPSIVSQRLDVVEALVTGEWLRAHQLQPSSRYGRPEITELSLPAQLNERELEFWYCLGEFVTRPPESSTPLGPNPPHQLDVWLGQMRHVLDQYENRDVLYSIAMVRHLGDQYADLVHSGSYDAEENRAAYFVAKGFIESQVTRGSNQVIQRVCQMAAQAFVD